MQLKKEMTIATLANWTGTLANFVLAFLATPIIVYSFGDVRYGIWSLVMSFTAYYGLLDFGISTSLIKYYSEYIAKNDEQSATKIINAAFFLYLLISLLLVIAVSALNIFVGTIFNIPPELLTETKFLVCITGIVFGIELIGNTFRAVITSLRKFVLRNFLNIVFSLVRIISLVTILKLGYGLVTAGWVILGICIIRNTTYALIAFKLSPFLKISYTFIDPLTIRASASFTFYNFLGKVSNRILERSDLILVAMFFDMQITACYSIAEALVRYSQMIPKGVRGIILPFSSKLNAQNDKEELKKMALILPKYTISFFLGIWLGMFFFGREFIELWMGPGYELSHSIAIILLLSKTIFMSQNILVHILAGMGFNRYFGILAVIELAIKICLSILLIEQFGIYGIALGSLFTFAITSLILVPNYALNKIKIRRIYYYVHALLLPCAVCVMIYAANSTMVMSILWSPVVALEYVLACYLIIRCASALSFKIEE